MMVIMDRENVGLLSLIVFEIVVFKHCYRFQCAKKRGMKVGWWTILPPKNMFWKVVDMQCKNFTAIIINVQIFYHKFLRQLRHGRPKGSGDVRRNDSCVKDTDIQNSRIILSWLCYLWFFLTEDHHSFLCISLIDTF